MCRRPWRGYINHMGMRRGLTHDLLIQTVQRWTKGRGWRDWREAYQSDHSGSCPGARYDVQVVGQVELKKKRQATVIILFKNNKHFLNVMRPDLMSCVQRGSHLTGVADIA